jgi:hypothetical protein
MCLFWTPCGKKKTTQKRTLFTAIIDHLPLLAERMELGLIDSGFLTLEGLEVLDAAFEIVPDLRVSSPTPYER